MTVTLIGPKDRAYKGPYINTTSSSKDWSQGLSPFLLGPVELYLHEDRMIRSRTFENAWQFCKVYNQFDAAGRPSDDYWAWASNGWNLSRGIRYPMGKGARPAYSWWNGEALGYIDARKRIYAPLYAECVLRTRAWELLKQIYEDTGEIVLWDYDGYRHRDLGMSYSDVVHCAEMTMGHSFVLAMLLEGNLAWQ